MEFENNINSNSVITTTENSIFHAGLDKLTKLETTLLHQNPENDNVSITKEIFDNYVDLINFLNQNILLKSFASS